MRIKAVDRVGKQILAALQRDARLPFREIGRQVGLTGPAVAGRVRQMEDAGLIRGYHAEVDLEQMGYPVQAFIRLRTTPDRYPRFLAMLDSLPEVIECHHVAGEDAFYLHVAVQSTRSLEQVIARLSPFGTTATAIILSTPLQRSVHIQAVV